jgi:dGTPase
MDWADDVTYAIHDLEDFYRAGLVPIDRLTVYRDERKRWVNEVFERRGQEEIGLTQDRFEEVADRVISSLVTVRPYKGTRADRAALRHTTSSLINLYAGAISLRVPASDDEPFVVIRPEAVDDVRILKELTWHFVISNPALATQQHGKERVIAELFSIFMDASTSKRWRNILPVRCREELGSLVSDQDRARVIADVVSSLSDQEAVSVHGRLTGVRTGSVLDFLLS